MNQALVAFIRENTFKMKTYRQSAATALACILVMTPLARALAEEIDPFQFFQEEARVVTASRREQSIQEAPVAIDVVTAEEIKASGAVHLWDLLRFRVGMDVLDGRSADGNRAVVSVRGFPQEFVRNLQVLVDGRSVYQPISGGVFWDQLPVQIQDIDHIEIVRGANAALYGSGAALGVINIITIKPSGKSIAKVWGAGGNQGIHQEGGAVESALKSFAGRLSVQNRAQDSTALTSGLAANNDLHSQQSNFRGRWGVSERSSLELFAGGSWNNAGLDKRPVADNQFNQHFEMAKWAQDVGSGSHIEFMSSRNDYLSVTDLSPVNPTQSRIYQYDEEFLHRFDTWNRRLQMAYGVNYRTSSAEDVSTFSEAPRQTQTLWNGYFNQTLHIADNLALSDALMVEHNDVGSGSTQPNYQVSSLWTVVDKQTLRASYSVAHTVPSLFSAGADSRSGPVLILGNPDVKPETLSTYEVSYRGTLFERCLDLETNYFYTHIKDVEVIPVQSITFFPAPLVTYSFNNSNDAIARGVELQAKYRFKAGHSLYANYTYEHITDWKASLGTLTQNTPAHKANLGGIAHFWKRVTASVNLGYKDHYFITSDTRQSSLAVPAYWRLDSRLAYRPAAAPNMELFMAVQNAATSQHIEFVDRTTVPRTYQGGLSMTFGGNE